MNARGRGRAFAVLFGVGAIGVVALLPTLIPLVADAVAGPGRGAPPLHVLVALASVQPLVLLAAGVALGVWLAPGLRLHSHLVAVPGAEGERSRFASELPLAAGVGIATAAVLLAVDAATRSWVSPMGSMMALTEGRTAAVTLAGVLYGGIAEELIVRWGLVTLLAWLALRAAGRRERPPPGVMWFAIAVAAVAFSAAHLPTLAARGIPLTSGVVARTLLLNGAGGLAFGWLYWRRSIEAAMVAHASVQVVWTLVALASS